MTRIRLLLSLLAVCMAPELFACLNVSQHVTAPSGPVRRFLTVSGTCDWVVSQVPGWILVSSGYTGSGNGTISIRLGRNLDPVPRSGVFYVNEKPVYVYQQGVDSIYPDFNRDGRTDLLWRHAGGTHGVVHATFMDGLSSNGGRWITIEPNPMWNAYPSYDWLSGGSDMYWVGGNGPEKTTDMKYIHEGGYVTSRSGFVSRAVIGGFLYHLINGGQHSTAPVIVDSSAAGLRLYFAVPWSTPIYTMPAGWELVAIADVDANLRVDFVFRHPGDGRVFVALRGNDPSEVLASGVVHTEPNLQWTIITAGDVDGDGRADLIWRNMTDGRIWTQLMNGLSWTPGNVVWTEPDPHWVLKGSGDFNGDGHGDLLFRNDLTGIVFVVLLENGAVLASRIAHYEPDMNWRLVGPTTSAAMLAANSTSVP